MEEVAADRYQDRVDQEDGGLWVSDIKHELSHDAR